MDLKKIFIGGSSSDSEDVTHIEPPKNITFKNIEPKTIDEGLALERRSEANYSAIVRDIVDISSEHLDNQNEEKDKLRKGFVWFFVGLLSLQMIAVVIFMVLTAISSVDFSISDSLMTAFIVSVFVETLGAITLMITFAFGSKEEVEVVKLLTEVIKNYQKYRKNSISDKETEKDKKDN